MPLEIRRADGNDIFFLVEALHKTFLYLSKCADNAYYRGMTEVPIESLETFALEYLEEHKARTFILYKDEDAIGCIMGKITSSNLGAAGIGLVGWIGLCYVDERYRGENHCLRMYDTMETWFKSMFIDTVELSYLAANEAAHTTWSRLGFEPLRTIAYKSI